MRPKLHDTLMAIAWEWSKRSTCTARVAVGAVLVNDSGRIVAAGYNGAPKGMPHCDDVGCTLVDGSCVSAIHAEENAILQCAREGVRTVGLKLYSTHSPCPRCALRIIQAGITHVYYEYSYKGYPETTRILTSAGVRIQNVGESEL